MFSKVPKAWKFFKRKYQMFLTIERARARKRLNSEAKAVVLSLAGEPRLAGFSGVYVKFPFFLQERDLRGDVVLLHQSKTESGMSKSNLPREYDYADQDTWGYSGNGPTCLAQNVLYHFTRSEDAAARHAIAFRDEIVRAFPNAESCLMDKSFIEAWIAAQPPNDAVI